MKLLWFLFALLCAAHGAPFPPHEQSACPSNCECLTVDLVTTTRCSSLDFIQHAPAETLNKVSHLDLRHSNLTKIGAIIKLHGLKSLNLAHNDIRHVPDLSSLTKLSILNLRGNKVKNFNLQHLPKSLEHLDISANHLSTFPDFKSIKEIEAGKNQKRSRLREVNLAGNPFVCSCELKTKYDYLQELAILIKPVTCRDGSGDIKEVTTLKCVGNNEGQGQSHNDLEKMQNEEAFDGSGEEPEPEHEKTNSEEEEDQTDVFADPESSERKLEEMQNEGLLPSATSSKSPDLTDDDYIDDGNENEEEEEEGSGHSGDDTDIPEDEGSGSEVLIIPSTEETPLKACNFDCSTPLTLEESNSTEPDPSIFDEVGKVFTDIFSDSDEEEEVEEDETEPSQEPSTESPRSDVIPILISEKAKVQLGSAPSEPSEPSEASEASEVKEAGNPFGLSNNMIIVIALLVVMGCIIIYSIIMKRRKNRRNARRGSIPAGQEMKTIKPSKPPRSSLSPSDNGKALPEKVPLINGQNGSHAPQNGAKNGGPKNGTSPTSFAAPTTEVTPSTPLINEPPIEKGDAIDPVEMRPPKSPRGDHSPLLPEAHRVTVQAKELTAPKTPLLVNRVRSYDGQIIATPETEQRF